MGVCLHVYCIISFSRLLYIKAIDSRLPSNRWTTCVQHRFHRRWRPAASVFYKFFLNRTSCWRAENTRRTMHHVLGSLNPYGTDGRIHHIKTLYTTTSNKEEGKNWMDGTSNNEEIQHPVRDRNEGGGGGGVGWKRRTLCDGYYWWHSLILPIAIHTRGSISPAGLLCNASQWVFRFPCEKDKEKKKEKERGFTPWLYTPFIDNMEMTGVRWTDRGSEEEGGKRERGT